MLIKRHARVANNDTSTQFECEADDSLSSSTSNRVLQNTVYHLSHDSRDIISNPPDATCVASHLKGVASVVQSAQQQHHIAMVAFCIRSPPSKAAFCLHLSATLCASFQGNMFPVHSRESRPTQAHHRCRYGCYWCPTRRGTTTAPTTT
jgi:hypothetical protein